MLASAWKAIVGALLLLALGGGVALGLVLGLKRDPDPGAASTNTTTVDGMEREFIVHVPEAVAGRTGAAAVIVLHGTGGTGAGFYNQKQGWRAKADEEAFIAVFPTALAYCQHDNGVQKIKTKWASGKLGGPELPLCSQAEIAALDRDIRALVDHPLADDVHFFDQLLGILERQYGVDSSKIFITGHSNGAGMALRLATERSSRFAAIAANAGGLGIAPTPAARPAPLLLTIGAEDFLFAKALGVPLPVVANELAANPAFQGLLQGLLDGPCYGLADTYAYSTTTFEGLPAHRFFIDTPSAGVAAVNHTLTFTVIDHLDHSYPGVDDYWQFFQTGVAA